MTRKLISPQTKRQIATRKYYQSPEGKKANRINTWKYRGIISKDYNAMYEEYLAQTNCEFCNSGKYSIKGNIFYIICLN